MPTLIPVLPGDLAGSADYRFGSTVAGALRLFDLHWNRAIDRWYLDVREADETPIFVGRKLVLGAYIGREANHELLRAGVFVVKDLSPEAEAGRPSEPTWLTLGRRHVLRWYDAQEVAAGLGFFDG